MKVVHKAESDDFVFVCQLYQQQNFLATKYNFEKYRNFFRSAHNQIMKVQKS